MFLSPHMCDVINYLTRVRSSFCGTSRSGLTVTTKITLFALVLLVSLQSSAWSFSISQKNVTPAKVSYSSTSLKSNPKAISKLPLDKDKAKSKAAKTSKTTTQVGLASWHAPSPRSKSSRTASQHRWASNELVAAHRTMPLGEFIAVINLENNKRVIVKVIDRGPYVHGRIVDLSKEAARQLDMVGNGVAHVRIEPVIPASSHKSWFKTSQIISIPSSSLMTMRLPMPMAAFPIDSIGEPETKLAITVSSLG